MENTIKVAYYGSEGSFSQEGAIKCVESIDDIDPTKKIEYIACGKDPKKVFLMVTKKRADFGVVPVENSDHGIINDVYDLLDQAKIYIVGEAINKINQNLLVNKGTKIEDIDTVFSHNAAVNQCKKFLSQYKWKIDTFADTATCAIKIKDEKLLNTAAIASERAAKLYDLKILHANIQDSLNNYTRFFLIGTRPYSGVGNKTSIIIKLRNGLNSLYDYMGYFVTRKIKIVKIDTRPSKDNLFEYIIYMDFLGNVDDENVEDALHDLYKDAKSAALLGCYKVADEPPIDTGGLLIDEDI